MIPLTAMFQIPTEIAAGLASGALERVGGVIRDTATKRVVLWLRDATTQEIPVGKLPLSSLTGVASTGVLPLAIATLGLTLITARLAAIESRLQQTQRLLEQVNTKLDVAFYANFRAALGLAQNALDMTGAHNRGNSAVQAINRFMEARHVYSALVDDRLAARREGIAEYLQTLTLAYVAEARCYLELNEPETARRTLQEGANNLRPRVEQFVTMLLTDNPAAYLHPYLSGKVTLRQLTRVCRWLDPSVDESAVFERERENLAFVIRNPQHWIERLPPVVWDHGVHYTGPRVPVVNIPVPGANIEQQVLSRLPQVMMLAEAAIEDSQRFDTYLTEIEMMVAMDLSFAEWCQLEPPPTSLTHGSGTMYVQPAEQHQIRV